MDGGNAPALPGLFFFCSNVLKDLSRLCLAARHHPLLKQGAEDPSRALAGSWQCSAAGAAIEGEEAIPHSLPSSSPAAWAAPELSPAQGFCGNSGGERTEWNWHRSQVPRVQI